MTPKEAEEHVRARWKDDYLYFWEISDDDPCAMLRIGCGGNGGIFEISFDEGDMAADQCWLAAADFTRQREEEIRQKQEEIRFLHEDVSYNTHVDAEKIIRRIIAILKSQLAALLVGWKEQAENEALRAKEQQ